MMSRPSGPLITLDPAHGPRPGMSRGKSVFGVDELWERDVRRLEALRAEEARVEATAAGAGKRRSGGEESVHPHTETLHEQGRDDTHVPPSISLGELSAALLAPEPHRTVTVDEWAAGSDEEGTGEPRRRRRRVAKAVPRQEEESSDDEVPLATAFGITRRPAGDESSEDEPLINLVRRRTVLP